MKKYIEIICLVISVVLYFFYTMMDSTVYFVGGTLFAFPGMVGLVKNNSGDLKIFTIIVLVGSLLDIVMTSYGIGGSIVFFVCCGITYLCLKNLNVFAVVVLLLCFGILAFLYNQMFIMGVADADVIFQQYGLSKNYPGSLLVIFNCYWAVWKHLRYKRLPLLLPIISTIMAFFLDGRSSLACMIMITVFCLVFRGSGRYKLIPFIALAAVFAFLLYHYWGVLEGYYELTRFADRGVESERTDLWRAYFEHLDIGSFLFGLDTQNIPLLREKGGNPHNTFLSFHRRMGFIGLCALLFYMLKGLLSLVKKKWFVVIYFCFVLIIRMFFDGMLVTAEDFFILTLFFFPLCYNNKIYRIEEQIQAHGNSWFERAWDKIVFII